MVEIELKPETEAALHQRAGENGVSAGEFAAMLLEDELASPPARVMTAARLEEFFRVMSEGWENRQPLPEEAFERESFYENEGW